MIGFHSFLCSFFAFLNKKILKIETVIFPFDFLELQFIRHNTQYQSSMNANILPIFLNIIFCSLMISVSPQFPPIYLSQTNLVAFCFCCLEPIDFCMSSGQRLIPSWPKSFHLSPRKTKKAIFIWKKKTLIITQVYHLPRRVCANVFLLFYHSPP